MKENIRTSIVRLYGKLCKKLKINNWQNHIFMENSIEIMEKLEQRISTLEQDNKLLKDNVSKISKIDILDKDISNLYEAINDISSILKKK